ncbi:phosphotransferase family protein [Sphingomonas sp. MMS24-JH45]
MPPATGATSCAAGGAVVCWRHRLGARYLASCARWRVPVPAMLDFCDDPRVVGTPVAGCRSSKGARDNRLDDMTPAERTAAYRGIATTLAALHAIDPVAAGLGDFGRPGNYFARQVARWTRQYRRRGRPRHPGDDRRPAAMPAESDGDGPSTPRCRMENSIFAPDAPRPVALLDWELSTLGHPIADVAFFCLFYHADFMPWGSAATATTSSQRRSGCSGHLPRDRPRRRDAEGMAS